MTSDTSSPAPRLHKPVQLFKLSQYAINSTPDGELGSYGAVLLKPMKLRAGGWRENEDLPPGTIIPGHVAARWPIQNRMALRENKYARFFLSPDEANELGVGLAAQAREHPTRAQVQAEEDRAAQTRAARAAGLAKARQVKAEMAAAAAEEKQHVT